MPDRRAVKEPQNGVTVYTYDGSFEGLLCCVFESYAEREMPADVLVDGEMLPLLLPIKRIDTSLERAERVRHSIPKKMGYQALYFVRRAFLTCHPNKGLLIMRFLRLGYKYGSSIMNRLTDDTVHALFTAVKLMDHEAHLYKGFVRFSDVSGALTSTIEPKNIVLPLIAQHFCERYPGEQFLIYDKTHGMVLLHQKGSVSIFGVEAFEQPEPGEEELKFRELWQLFYRTIEIKERHNPRCRMTHMPKRYWNCMTEFFGENKKNFIDNKLTLPSVPD
jgi:probable DNA metabolism protein